MTCSQFDSFEIQAESHTCMTTANEHNSEISYKLLCIKIKLHYIGGMPRDMQQVKLQDNGKNSCKATFCHAPGRLEVRRWVGETWGLHFLCVYLCVCVCFFKQLHLIGQVRWKMLKFFTNQIELCWSGEEILKVSWREMLKFFSQSYHVGQVQPINLFNLD